MNVFFSSLSSFFDLLFIPFQNVAPIWPVLFFSLVTAFLMLVVFRYASNQEGIRRAKAKLGAHLLEVRLFQDQLGVVMRAYARLLASTSAYLLYALKPLVVMIVPLILIMAQLELRLGRDSLIGKPVLLKATLVPGTGLEAIELKAPQGVAITSPALPIPELNEVDWRIEGTKAGSFVLELTAGTATTTKQFTMATGNTRISPLRTSSVLEWFLYPGEARLDGDIFRSIEVLHPARTMNVLGWKVHWLIPFFVFSLIFSYALKGVVGVEF